MPRSSTGTDSNRDEETYDEEAYEDERLANIPLNEKLVMDLAIPPPNPLHSPVEQILAPMPLILDPPPRRSARQIKRDSSSVRTIWPRDDYRRGASSEKTVETIEKKVETDNEKDDTNDEDEDDYEAERLATIKLNQELLESLGLGASTSSPSSLWKSGKKKPSKVASTSTSSTTATGETTPVRRSGRNRTPSSRAKGNYSEEGGWRRRGRASYTWEEVDSEEEGKEKYLQRLYQGSVAGRTENPKVFGNIPGVEIGRTWEQRAGASRDAVHAPLVAGISGNAERGAWSVCFSGGYEDNMDEGDRFIITGCGGRDLKGTKAAPKNLRTAPQTSDQTMDNVFNASLFRSSQTGKPIRVCRGYKTMSNFAPQAGYRYDGLYKVVRAWTEKSQTTNYLICKFEFRRLPGQPRIPLRSDNQEVAVLDEEDAQEDEDVNVDEVDEALIETALVPTIQSDVGSFKRRRDVLEVDYEIEYMGMSMPSGSRKIRNSRNAAPLSKKKKGDHLPRVIVLVD